MSRTLLLTSSGISPKLAVALAPILFKSSKDIQIAFIPTAADPEENKWFIEPAYASLKKFSPRIITVDLKSNPREIRSNLESCQVIFVNGGNTFYLLDWIRKSQLDSYLGDLLNQEKTYIGVSAGSIVVGPNIESAEWGIDGDKNINNLQDKTGLNLVPFAVFPHFQSGHQPLLESKLKAVNYEIKPLSDGQALLVIDDKCQTL